MVEPPMAVLTRMAFSKLARVRMADGLIPVAVLADSLGIPKPAKV